MTSDRVVKLLTEATRKWVTIRGCSGTFVIKCLSVAQEIDVIRIEAERRIDDVTDAPPYQETAYRFADDSPIFRTTIVIEPDTISSICIFKTKAGPINDD